jgi:hypothetical protein
VDSSQSLEGKNDFFPIASSSDIVTHLYFCSRRKRWIICNRTIYWCLMCVSFHEEFSCFCNLKSTKNKANPKRPCVV